jgi:hypothetical protein
LPSRSERAKKIASAATIPQTTNSLAANISSSPCHANKKRPLHFRDHGMVQRMLSTG